MTPIELDLALHSPRLSLRREHFSSLLSAKKLLIRGHPEEALLRARAPSLAIIGTRRPTDYGKDFVRALMAQLSMDFPFLNILSGGAFGIDTEAHVEALRVGMSTQAWVVGPIDSPNPKSHHRLYSRMEETTGCAVMSVDDLDPGHLGRPPMAFDWIKRNAWLVAAADAVVVVEATVNSGTSSSVDFAAQMGVPVFILPGPVFSPQSLGTNLMISKGSGCVIEGVEILTKRLLVELGQGSYNSR